MEPLALSIPQAAKALSISDETLRRIIARGEIRTIKISETRRILMTDLREYLERRAEAENPQPLPQSAGWRAGKGPSRHGRVG